MKKYQSIQYLRAMAALLVVFHHARNPAPGLYDPLSGFGAGQAGVDIFFVISGFIMYSAAREESPLDFARRRIIRVVPLYWIATLLTLVISIGLKGRGSFVAKDIIESLLFIPHYSYANPGQIWPYLIPGWTLNFEMFFYVVFAAGLLIKRVVPVIVITMMTLVGAGVFWPSNNPLWSTYTNPLLIEFMAGVLIAKWSARDMPPHFIILLPLGIIAVALSVVATGPRVLLWGIPAAMMVAGAVALDHNRKTPRWRLLGLIGDASYSIYLFQVLSLGRVALFIRKLALEGPVQLISLIAISLIATTALGIVIHFIIERPLTRYLSRLTQKGSTRGAAPILAADRSAE